MNICVICGYHHYTEKHHPDGKGTFIFVDGKRFPYTPEKHNELAKKYGNEFNRHVFIREQHFFPDRYMMVCANCHALITKKKMTPEQVKRLVVRNIEIITDFNDQNRTDIRTLIDFAFEQSRKKRLKKEILIVSTRLSELLDKLPIIIDSKS